MQDDCPSTSTRETPPRRANSIESARRSNEVSGSKSEAASDLGNAVPIISGCFEIALASYADGADPVKSRIVSTHVHVLETKPEDLVVGPSGKRPLDELLRFGLETGCK